MYTMQHIYSSITNLVGEERRWVERRTMQRAYKEVRAAALKSWITCTIACDNSDPLARDLWLREAQYVAQTTALDSNSTAAHVRGTLIKLYFYRDKLSEHLARCGPPARKRIREILGLFMEKIGALEALATKKEAAGESDVSDVMPSQRSELCRELDGRGLAPDLHEEVREVCRALDRLRAAALTSEQRDGAVAEAVGRLRVLRSRPGLSHLDLVDTLEALFLEEIRWIQVHDS
mmetsp:Transcript_106894/g.307424  ORF Transcript_106894/g.307424 Transcript_106894/m.307424 type:complete len:234 (-) Transcript_106894:76-777(-)